MRVPLPNQLKCVVSLICCIWKGKTIPEIHTDSGKTRRPAGTRTSWPFRQNCYASDLSTVSSIIYKMRKPQVVEELAQRCICHQRSVHAEAGGQHRRVPLNTGPTEGDLAPNCAPYQQWTKLWARVSVCVIQKALREDGSSVSAFFRSDSAFSPLTESCPSFGCARLHQQLQPRGDVGIAPPRRPPVWTSAAVTEWGKDDIYRKGPESSENFTSDL